MGFDDMGAQDQIYTSEGIDVLIADPCRELLRGATLDFVEINPGQPEFIFTNPNDPRHTPRQPENA
jgi:iron-sulfur cluster assembly protein